MQRQIARIANIPVISCPKRDGGAISAAMVLAPKRQLAVHARHKRQYRTILKLRNV